MKKRRLSPAQFRALKAIHEGHSPGFYAGSMSEYGGVNGTVVSLIRNELIDREHNLLPRGLDAFRSGFYVVAQAKGGSK